MMFHEVAHGLGIKNTIDGKGTVREALKEQAGALEEGEGGHPRPLHGDPAAGAGRAAGATMDDNYVTFLARIFRSVRFGAADGARPRQRGAVQLPAAIAARSPASGDRAGTAWTSPRCAPAVDSLADQILRFQGDGDYAGVTAFLAQRGAIAPDLQTDLDRLATRKIPVDVVFEQGPAVLGLEQ